MIQKEIGEKKALLLARWISILQRVEWVRISGNTFKFVEECSMHECRICDFSR